DRLPLVRFHFELKATDHGLKPSLRGTRDPLLSMTVFEAVDADGSNVTPSMKGAPAFVDPTVDQARVNVESALRTYREPGIVPRSYDLRRGSAVVSFYRLSDGSSLPTGFRLTFESDGEGVKTTLVGPESIPKRCRL